MPKHTTADRLKQIMDMRGLKQIDIINSAQPYCDAYKIKLGRNDISQYLSGKVEPRQNKLYILAKALNVSEAWLMGYDVSMERKDDRDSRERLPLPSNIIPITQVKRKKVPLLGDIACGQPIFADETKTEYVLADEKINADFCLKCHGDSMTGARINDGDIVFIRQQSMVDNGDIAAVIIDDEATLKRVYYYPNRGKLILNAENPKYAPFVFTGEELNQIRILGKAVAFQSSII